MAESGDEPPLVADVHTRARLWVRDPFLAATQYPQPERWSETTDLNQLVASAFGVEPDTLTGPTNNGTLDARVQTLLGRWAEGIDQARLREAIRGAAQDDLIRSKPQLQSLVTILKDSNAVDKYCRLAKSKDPKPPSKSNVEHLTDEARERRRKFRAGEI